MKADSTVITKRAAIAAEKMSDRGDFMAITAAMKKVLSPISETRMTMKDLRRTDFWTVTSPAVGSGDAAAENCPCAIVWSAADMFRAARYRKLRKGESFRGFV